MYVESRGFLYRVKDNSNWKIKEIFVVIFAAVGFVKLFSDGLWGWDHKQGLSQSYLKYFWVSYSSFVLFSSLHITGS